MNFPGIFPVPVVGTKNAGKTTFLEYLISRARKRHLAVAGFLSRGEVRDGHKRAYFLEDINTGERQLLAMDARWPEAFIQYGSYYFNPKVFKRGNQLLLNNMNMDVLVLDEFGPLELRGEGFRWAFDRILQEYRGIFMIAVRPSILTELLNILKSCRISSISSEPY